jgi:hypothetical protein
MELDSINLRASARLPNKKLQQGYTSRDRNVNAQGKNL